MTGTGRGPCTLPAVTVVAMEAMEAMEAMGA